MLDGRAHREVEAHLAECPACAAELKAQNEAMSLVEQFGAVNPPPGLFNAVRNRIEAGDFQRERPAWWAFLFTKPARAGAMGLAMAAVAAGLFLPAGPSSTPGPLPPFISNGGTVAESAQVTLSIRQHAMSAGQGTLTDRVAWEAVAQLVQERDQKKGQKRTDGE
jgi:hypothetical protein